MWWVLVEGALRGDDFRSWHWLDVVTIDHKYYRNSIHLETRLCDDSSDFELALGGIYNSTPLADHTRIGLNFIYYEVFPQRGDSVGVFYVEPDLINTVNLGESKIALTLRQRLEIRFIEDKDGVFPRSRHQASLRRPITGAGPLQSVFASEEFFYDWDSGEVCQNRLIPAGLTLEVHDHADISIYYMLLSEDTARGWHNSHVVGTQIQLAF